MPTLDPTQKDTAEAETFANMWNDYVLNYRPKEEAFYADVLGFRLPDRNDPDKPSWEELVQGSGDSATMANRRDDLGGRVQADIVQAASVPPAGMNPARLATDTQATGRLGKALAKGGVAADTQVTEKRLQGMQVISALGRGQQTDAANNLATSSHLASQSAMNDATNDATNDMASKNLTSSMVGSAAGAGMYYANKVPAAQPTGGSVGSYTPAQRTSIYNALGVQPQVSYP